MLWSAVSCAAEQPNQLLLSEFNLIIEFQVVIIPRRVLGERRTPSHIVRGDWRGRLHQCRLSLPYSCVYLPDRPVELFVVSSSQLSSREMSSEGLK